MEVLSSSGKEQTAGSKGIVITVMVICLMNIISIDAIITRVWQHAGSLLPASVLCCACLCLPEATTDI